MWKRALHRVTWLVAGFGFLAGLAILLQDDPDAVDCRDVIPGAAGSATTEGSESAVVDEPCFEAVVESLGEGRMLKGPGSAAVLAVGFADGGLRAVAVGDDGSLRSWNECDGSAGRTVSFGGKGFYSGVYVPARGRLVTVCTDCRLRAWDTSTGGEIGSRLFEGPSMTRFPNSSIAVAANGSTAAYSSNQVEVQILNVEDANANASWRVSKGTSVSAFSLSADGRLLILGVLSRKPGENRVEVRETATGRLVHRMAGHRGMVLAVGVSPDGSQVFSTGKDRTLRVWDLATGRALGRHGLLPGAGYHLAVSPRERHVLVGTGHGWSHDAWLAADAYGVQVWDLNSGHPLGLFKTAGPVSAVAVSPDGRHALAASEDGSVYLWPMPGGGSAGRSSDGSIRADEGAVRVPSAP